MRERGSALWRIVCWYCVHEWLTRGRKSARCPSCRTLNHGPKRDAARRAAGVSL